MPHRILACDHEPHVNRIMSLKLERAGFDVRTTSDGEAAWNRIHERSPDLLIVDADMPGVDDQSAACGPNRMAAIGR
jgi:DNA-binding response OmpR family regulator